MMGLLVSAFSWLMDVCHQLIPNYWIDIVIFTAITKVLQFPITLWCHSNSLKMVSLMPLTNRIKVRYFGDKDKIGEETAELFKREHYHPLLSLVPLAIQIVILMGFVRVIYAIADVEKDSPIGMIPMRDGGISWMMPFIAGVAAWFLGWCQNRINPLQHEQTRAQQMTTNGISIGISLFLGSYVGMGVGLYWAASNVFSILTQLWCNVTIVPKSRVNYSELYKSRKELQDLEKSVTKVVSKEDRLREKRDYKRFFNIANKHLVVYAESGGFYKYFQSTIDWLIAHSNVVVHYVTNDPNDAVFSHPLAVTEPARIRPYYIGPMKIIPLMMKMDADIVLMSTPDLNTYQIKRSYVRKDVEYVYMPHGMSSMTLTFRKGAFDHFDTIFAEGPFQIDEHRATEAVYGLKKKNLIPVGFPYLDLLMAQAKAHSGEKHDKLRILIGPSHQPDNIIESCLDGLLESIVRDDREVIVRPHPQYVRRSPARIQEMLVKYKDRIGANLSFETDFSKATSVFDVDILITDWSAIAFEFAFTTNRPVLFIDTPMKVTNPEYAKIGIEPNDIAYRCRLGFSVEPKRIQEVENRIGEICANREAIAREIGETLNRDYFNPGHAGEVAGRYIVNSLIARKKGTKK